MSIVLKTTGSGSIEAIYEDHALEFLAKLGSLGPAKRVSHVDPGPLVDGRPTWMIVWRDKFVDLFGEVTTCRHDGSYFFTKQAAVDYEVSLLRTHYFALPEGGGHEV